ncbi:SAM-dependent methyltransferase [Ensifer sp. ENS10]|jgi:tRNA (Thr-GGU) A37 N-methylase|nr:SAM-dependent methyltransferase [Ensifer sp. ENS10]MBV7518702.1 SAM-dependent methyltransferase [Ensifer sp. ENS12]
MDQSKRGQDGPGLDCQIAVHGTFSLRSPVRPNLIGTSTVKLEAVEGSTLLVRSLDCLDGTTPFKPIAPPQRGDFEAGDSGPHNCQKA